MRSLLATPASNVLIAGTKFDEIHEKDDSDRSDEHDLDGFSDFDIKPKTRVGVKKGIQTAQQTSVSASKQKKNTKPPPDAVTWTYDDNKNEDESPLQHTKENIEKLRQEFGIKELELVIEPKLLEIVEEVDFAKLVIGEAKLVKGDGPIAEYVNYSIPVQMATALAAYLPFTVITAAAAQFNTDTRMQSMLHFIHNRTQCSETSDMAAWLSASVAAYSYADMGRQCVLALLGNFSQRVGHKVLELPGRPIGNAAATWFSHYGQNRNAIVQLCEQQMSDERASHCLLEFRDSGDNKSLKPNLEDMRQIMRDICAYNKQNRSNIMPLCYIYSLNDRRLRGANDNDKQGVFRVIDSSCQLREQMRTKVHFMLVALNYNHDTDQDGRYLGTMPCRVCPMCGFTQLADTTTRFKFENHIYVEEYQCVLSRYFTKKRVSQEIDNNKSKSNFFKANIEFMDPLICVDAIMKQFTLTDAWRALCRVVMDMVNTTTTTAEIDDRNRKFRDALDLLQDTLQMPLVIGQNKFLRDACNAANLCHVDSHQMQKWVDLMSRQTGRVFAKLMSSAADFKRLFQPNIVNNVYYGQVADSGIPEADADFSRPIMLFEYCRFAIKVFLLNALPTAFASVDEVASSDNHSISTKLMTMAALRPRRQFFDYCQDLKFATDVGRVPERTKGAYAWTREHVEIKEAKAEALDVDNQTEAADKEPTESVADTRLAELRAMMGENSARAAASAASAADPVTIKQKRQAMAGLRAFFLDIKNELIAEHAEQAQRSREQRQKQLTDKTAVMGTVPDLSEFQNLDELMDPYDNYVHQLESMPDFPYFPGFVSQGMDDAEQDNV
jgi:hypothetical protein